LPPAPGRSLASAGGGPLLRHDREGTMKDPAIRNNTPPPPAPHVAPLPHARPGVLSWILGVLPTFLALALLAAVGAWGYYEDWKLPSLAKLFGEEKKDENADWCKEHGVPEEICVECKPNLLPKPPAYKWCDKHGVHDCPLEHPDVAQLATVPQITKEDLERADRALNFSPRKENDESCKLHQRRLQLASVEAFRRTEIEVEKVGTARMVEGISAPGEITYDPTRVARVSARVSGTIRKMLRGLGDKVRRGEVIALVDSADVGRAKADFLQAAAQFNLRSQTLERLEKIGPEAIPMARILEAQTALQEAKIRLLVAEQALATLGLPVRPEDYKGLEPEELARRVRQLGLPDNLGKMLDDDLPMANLVPVRSPLEGEVVSRLTVAGERIDPNKVIVVVADTSRMALVLNVRQEDSGRLSLGHTVEFQPNSGGPLEKGLKISWISPSVDEKTRTVAAQALLDNKDGRLRAKTFGTGTIIIREEPEAVVVPNGAVHWDGKCNIVFVLDKNSLFVRKKEIPEADKKKLVVFHVRCVRLGARDAKHTEIIAGVLPGEFVADENSEVLRGQLLKDSLGGGD
jgi:cobalt-zinc-cadmium efflux system membrane fusion protein